MLRHGVAGVIMEAMSIAESPPTEGRDRLGPTRRRVLAHLQEVADPLGSDTLATALGLHANTVRFHLDALIRDGLVRRLLDRQGRQGRPRVLYSAAPEGPSVSDLPFRALAETLLAFVRDHDDVLSPEAIGESWGRSMVGNSAKTSIEALVDEVNRLGLTSRLTTDEVGELVEIVRCPVPRPDRGWRSDGVPDPPRHAARLPLRGRRRAHGDRVAAVGRSRVVHRPAGPGGS